MVKGLFDGKGFEKLQYKPLMPRYYTSEYKSYIEEETKLLKKNLRGIGSKHKILEAGVGIGRLIPIIAPLAKEFVGIDNSRFMLDKAKKVGSKFPNVRIIEGDLEKVSSLFPPNYFDFTLLLWNTLGNISDETKVMRGLSKITKKRIFVTVHLKGKIKERERWCKKIGQKILKIDVENEIFYFEGNIKSKAYNFEDINEIAKKSRWVVKAEGILGGAVLSVELSKN